MFVYNEIFALQESHAAQIGS